MTRGILIAGPESSLTAAIGAEACKRVEQYAAANIPGRFSGPLRDGEKAPCLEPGPSARIPLVWNPASPLSARTLTLAAENCLEHVDEAILVCTPPSLRTGPEDLAPADVEAVLNDHLKGWFFLSRELCRMFRDRGAGTLALVLQEPAPGGEPADLLGPAVGAAFRAFAQSLLASQPGKAYEVYGFSAESADAADFAAFIFKIIEERGRRNAGKWHKYGRLGIFGR
ncbi:MAG: hypothetical protein LBT11_07725 [Treponema sp.]|jgi:hypothetical protein|nr:hypothetical protein [Treponema sp.]